MNAIARALPAFAKVSWVTLGRWPSPVEPLDAVGERLGLARGQLWVKREDVSAEGYGGNKIRTLEARFGEAKALGAARIWATGAYGSNHALATVRHAARAGMSSGVALFPQPASEAAVENLEATLSLRPAVRDLLHWSSLPFAMAAIRRSARKQGEQVLVMEPGGATPIGALGHVAAAFELAEQIAEGVCPLPRRIFVGAGSTCTSAGLLAGLTLAARMGKLAGRPQVIAVRVTPWPVTGKFRILGLAHRTVRHLESIVGGVARISRAELSAGLTSLGGEIGRGYGHPTPRGKDAIALFATCGGPALDCCYTGKVVAGMTRLVLAAPDDGPVLYWSSKSTLPMDAPDAAAIGEAPARMRRWLERGHRLLENTEVAARALPR